MALDLPLLIVGGGIGGMAAALAVARAGRPVHVLEKAEQFGEIGAGIQLAPNATRVLDRLGLLPAVEAVAVFPERVRFMHADAGCHLTTLDLGPAFRRHFGYRYLVMHRGDLLDILLEACRGNELIRLESNRTVAAIEDRPSSVAVRCEDGSTYECEAVVGADGLWSCVRARISDDRPICAEYVAYRGAIPTSEVTVEIEHNDELVWIAPGMHFVQYPIRRGEIYNQVAVFKSARYREEIVDTEAWGTPEELDQRFAACCPPVRAAVTMINRDRRWPMYDREPLGAWTRGRVTLLGDAAHPMLQYLAQGACQAIEDADCLGRKLAEHPGDVTRAFAAYEAERIPRTARVQRTARLWGQVWHDPGPLIPWLRDRFFALRAPDDYSELDWLYRPS
jgi:2-polyprenyl-6-methoxyphenol hydroxylase-like FAD-dependent oxidoreductase